MRTICLYFEIHQIIHLKRYRFFDIGNEHYYYDDYFNDYQNKHINYIVKVKNNKKTMYVVCNKKLKKVENY